MTSPGGPPTVETIAAAAGVSIASVSRVLNGHGARPDTIRRVEKAAAELGYVPNRVARSLKGGRTRQLTFAMPDIGNPAYVSMVRQIQTVTKPLGYRLLLHSTDAVAEDELDVVRSLADRTSDGLIICPIRVTEDLLEALSTAAGPVVVIGSLPEAARVDSVGADSVSGAVLAVRHLVALGRRRIGFVNGPAGTLPGANRAAGYRSALAGAGLPVDASLTVTTDFSVGAGATAAHRLLDTGPGIDGVFCANDRLALGVTYAALDRGLRIPEDLAVVGMDDSELARAGHPALTSVDLGSGERGGLAARMLLARLDAAQTGAGATPAPHGQRTTVAPRLVVRASTAGREAAAPAHTTTGSAHSGSVSPGPPHTRSVRTGAAPPTPSLHSRADDASTACGRGAV